MQNMVEPLFVVSGDGHIGAEAETYRPYFEPKYRAYIDDIEKENKRFQEISETIQPPPPEAMLEAMDPDGVWGSGEHVSGWDVKRRIQELDREGVAAEVVFPGHARAIQPLFSVVNNPWPADVRAAGVRAYHRWAADRFAESDGRIFGVADAGPCLDMAETVRELEWCADHAFVSTQPPGNTADPALPLITDRYYDPFWAVCAERGLVINAHAGFGQTPGKFWDFAEGFLKNVVGSISGSEKVGSIMQAFEGAEDSPFKLDMGPRRLVWQLVLGGVFDRHPNLKLCLTEVRADWVPANLKRLDALAAENRTPLKMTPSEYWARNCFVTPSSVHICEIDMREQIGVDNLIFGTDYPHREGTWPNTKDWIRMSFKGVAEAEARKLLAGNAIRCFGLDRDKLLPIARRIGFDPAEVLVDEPNVHRKR